MPPKFKFTREEIINACFYLAKKDGLKAVTARGVAAELGSSSKVIFSLFRDMEEVRSEVINKAKCLYKDYVDEGLKHLLPFKGVGESYIRFAKEEPKLFQLLFMQESKNPANALTALIGLDDNYDRILSCVESSYGLEKEEAAELYKCLWVSTHGIAVLCATGVYDFSVEEIQNTLSKIIKGLLIQYKGAEKKLKK